MLTQNSTIHKQRETNCSEVKRLFGTLYILLKITLYQMKGWCTGRVDCEFHCPELPPDGPKSSPLIPI